MNIKKFEEYKFWEKLARELCDLYIAQYTDFESSKLHKNGFEVKTKTGGQRFWTFGELSERYLKKIGWTN